jgi:Uma2 family endonuclease
MGLPQKIHYYTPEEYLALEEASEERHEYHDGEIFAMAGGSFEHGRIVSNMNRLLGNALHGSKCSTFDSTVKIKVESTRSYVYPDITVICGKIEHDTDQKTVAKNPLLLVEVLSESTSGYDRGLKYYKYKQLPSLEVYILIEQSFALVDVFRKAEDGEWKSKSYFGLDAVVEVPVFGFKIPVAEIYNNVPFTLSDSEE